VSEIDLGTAKPEGEVHAGIKFLALKGLKFVSYYIVSNM